MKLWWILTLAFVLPVTSHAQRRDGGKAAKVLVVTLSEAAEFGKQLVYAGAYKVIFNEGILVLRNPKSLSKEIRLRGKTTRSEMPQDNPTATTAIRKNTLEIVYRSGNMIYTTKGKVKPKALPTEDSLALSKSEERTVGSTGGISVEQNDRDNAAVALKRYVGGVEHCADQGRKSRWKTDDARFEACVCPITKKWRMPKLETQVWVHHRFGKKRFGFSIEVSPKGRIKGCRVWAGTRAPQ